MKKAYEPTSFEDRLYAEWEQKGYFRAEDGSSKPAFTIPMPPPNVTGALHNGHALFVTLQDALVRWKRMSGFNTLWLPGTDHAGIATQMVVERELAKEGSSRHVLGRKAFEERIWDWKNKHGEIIIRQMKKLGASPDWDRLNFTMDPHVSRAVRIVFEKLYKEGLIYRGTRITSRCTRCETVLSDLEVISKERKSHLWHLRYFTSDKKKHLVVATTRPETLLGDTAVAVHPEDARYQALIGTEVELPLVGRKIPVIGDEHVEKEFGTGVLKVTPAHDFNDYEIGKRHNLPLITVIDASGKFNTNAPKQYQGLSVVKARELIVQELQDAGHLEKTEEITQQASLCQRCETVVEPLVSEQWFMRMKPLAEKCIAAARKGEKLSLDEIDKQDEAFKIVPETWYATYYHWMENIRDWCVSRQLWWGHRIPAWFCDACKKITVSSEDVKNCEHCKSDQVRQDEDVLDTWFSAGLWPFATLGWPEKTAAYQTFYPASVLETGFDILFFWVARMLMMGIHFNDGKVPFRRVYLHAMVRDEKGQKMSKTKGNVIDPLDLIRDHGADAFRFTLLSMSGQGRDIRLSIDRVEGYGAFCNKIWNASRYVLMRLGHVNAEENIQGMPSEPVDFNRITGGLSAEQWISSNRKKLHTVNRWILSRFEKAAESINAGLDEFKMSEASQELYSFVWLDFCDWYIEFSKELLRTPEHAAETQLCLAYVLKRTLALAHPFIPFISEEIFKSAPKLPGDKTESLMVTPFPLSPAEKDAPRFGDVSAEESVGIWKDSVERIRAFRSENGVSPKARPEMTFEAVAGDEARFREGVSLISSLAQLGALKEEGGELRGKSDTGEVLLKAAKVFVCLRGLVDVDGELRRLTKEKATVESDISFVEKKLAREDFIKRAPPELVEAEKEKLSKFKASLGMIQSSIDRLSKLR